jgi:hypothetical protein
MEIYDGDEDPDKSPAPNYKAEVCSVLSYFFFLGSLVLGIVSFMSYLEMSNQMKAILSLISFVRAHFTYLKISKRYLNVQACWK